MDDENPGNPGHITADLCLAYRQTMTAEREAMQDKITFTIKITGAVITILVSAVVFILRFYA